MKRAGAIPSGEGMEDPAEPVPEIRMAGDGGTSGQDAPARVTRKMAHPRQLHWVTLTIRIPRPLPPARRLPCGVPHVPQLLAKALLRRGG